MSHKKALYWDYFILCARVLLAWTLISYGFEKLIGEQFGLSAADLEKHVKALGLFKLSWYLFDKEPFKSFVAISQILAGGLLLYNRTLILGCLLSIPIFANILIIDITYLGMVGFYWRLSYYLVLVFLILWHYKERLIIAFRALFSGTSTKFKFPLWAYLILPFMAVILDIVGITPRFICNLIFHPAETLNGLSSIPAILNEIVEKISSLF